MPLGDVPPYESRLICPSALLVLRPLPTTTLFFLVLWVRVPLSVSERPGARLAQIGLRKGLEFDLRDFRLGVVPRGLGKGSCD